MASRTKYPKPFSAELFHTVPGNQCHYVGDGSRHELPSSSWILELVQVYLAYANEVEEHRNTRGFKLNGDDEDDDHDVGCAYLS